MNPIEATLHHLVGETMKPADFASFYAESLAMLKLLGAVWLVLGLAGFVLPLGWPGYAALVVLAGVAALLIVAAITWLYSTYGTDDPEYWPNELVGESNTSLTGPNQQPT